MAIRLMAVHLGLSCHDVFTEFLQLCDFFRQSNDGSYKLERLLVM